jgi:hypothetical protein
MRTRLARLLRRAANRLDPPRDQPSTVVVNLYGDASAFNRAMFRARDAVTRWGH